MCVVLAVQNCRTEFVTVGWSMPCFSLVEAIFITKSQALSTGPGPNYRGDLYAMSVVHFRKAGAGSIVSRIPQRLPRRTMGICRNRSLVMTGFYYASGGSNPPLDAGRVKCSP